MLEASQLLLGAVYIETIQGQPWPKPIQFPGRGAGKASRSWRGRLEFCNGVSWCVIRLYLLVGRARGCSGCGRQATAIHDVEERRVRDSPVFEHHAELVVPRVRRLRGIRRGSSSGGRGSSRMRALHAARGVGVRSCAVPSICHVARFLALLGRRREDRRRVPVNHVVFDIGDGDSSGFTVVNGCSTLEGLLLDSTEVVAYAPRRTTNVYIAEAAARSAELMRHQGKRYGRFG